MTVIIVGGFALALLVYYIIELNLKGNEKMNQPSDPSKVETSAIRMSPENPIKERPITDNSTAVEDSSTLTIEGDYFPGGTKNTKEKPHVTDSTNNSTRVTNNSKIEIKGDYFPGGSKTDTVK